MKSKRDHKLGLTVRLLGLGCLILAVLTGCFPVALHPFYMPKDVVFDPALLGVWAENIDDEENWTFVAGTNRNYRVTIKEAKRADHLEAFLFKLGTNSYLDFTFAEFGGRECELEGFAAFHLTPVHSLAQMRMRNDELRLAFMDLQWLEKLLTDNPKAIRHEKVAIAGDTNDTRLILTASTRELQEFIQKYSHEAFLKDPDSLKRITKQP